MDTVCIDKRSGIPEKRNHVYDDGTLILLVHALAAYPSIHMGHMVLFIGFVPLIVARLFMYIGKIPVENGTPEETEEASKRSTRRGKSAGERSETVIVLRRTSAVLRFTTEYSEYADQDV